MMRRVTRRSLVRGIALGASAIAAHRLGFTHAFADGEEPQGAATTDNILYRLHIPGLASDRVTPPPPPPPQKYVAPTVFYAGDKTKNRIYLTIDDCSSLSAVSDAMTVAEQYGARLTFFPIGTVVISNPSFWKNAVARRHAVENHTYDHAYLSKLTTAQIRQEMLAQANAVESAVGNGYRPKFVRPPAGDGIYNYDPRLPAVAQELGFKIAMWNSDSNGWRVHPRTDQAAVNYVLANVFANFERGSILIQHALSVDVLALPAILQEAGKRGYECLALRDGIA